MINVHIKSTPYNCRYEDCDKAYNDRSNRRTHEIKAHGGLHPSVLDEMITTNRYSSKTMQMHNVQTADSSSSDVPAEK